MTNTIRESIKAGRKAHLQVLLKRISDSFDAASEEQQTRLMRSLEELARPDRRKNPRSPSLLQITIDDVHSGIAGNISADGAVIRTPVSFSVGQQIRMAFPFPGSREPSKIRGEVTWTHQMVVGVKFISVTKDFEALLESL
jgi:hypothetical protein